MMMMMMMMEGKRALGMELREIYIIFYLLEVEGTLTHVAHHASSSLRSYRCMRLGGKGVTQLNEL
jgi:hypothetical protein